MDHLRNLQNLVQDLEENLNPVPVFEPMFLDMAEFEDEVFEEV